MIPDTHKPVVYIAGPFRAAHDYGRKLNVDRAEALAFKVFQMDAVALTPHLNTAHFDGALPDTVWLPAALELMRRCDAVLLLHNWAESVGAINERAVAIERDMPVFDTGTLYWQEELEEWIGKWYTIHQDQDPA